jgi:hypothetical protein
LGATERNPNSPNRCSATSYSFAIGKGMVSERDHLEESGCSAAIESCATASCPRRTSRGLPVAAPFPRATDLYLLSGNPESVSEKGTGTFCSADTDMGKADPTRAPQNEPVPNAFRMASYILRTNQPYVQRPNQRAWSPSSRFDGDAPHDQSIEPETPSRGGSLTGTPGFRGDGLHLAHNSWHTTRRMVLPGFHLLTIEEATDGSCRLD